MPPWPLPATYNIIAIRGRAIQTSLRTISTAGGASPALLPGPLPLLGLASPALADDLSGLAPAAVFTAGFDPLRDDGRAYADALTKAGVPVQYRCYDDMVHGFFGMGILPGGMDMATEVCAAMGALMTNG